MDKTDEEVLRKIMDLEDKILSRPRLDGLLYRLCNVTEAKLVLLVDLTGRELSSHGIPHVRVNLRPLIEELGDQDTAYLALARLIATEPRWAVDDGSENDHADVAVLDGRWCLLFVFRAKEDLDFDRGYITPFIDALRDTLADTSRGHEPPRGPGAPVAPPRPRGGGSSSPAELGIPIWWIRRTRELRR
jgi:hypothetical protein